MTPPTGRERARRGFRPGGPGRDGDAGWRKAAGPLGMLIELSKEGVQLRTVPAGPGVNALILLRRVWPEPASSADDGEDGGASRFLDGARRWAQRTRFGEEPELLAAAQARRALAARRLGEFGYTSMELSLKPLSRVVVGFSGPIPDVPSAAMHGSYGCPMLPASSLKGAAKAYAARPAKASPDEISRVFGSVPQRKGAAASAAIEEEPAEGNPTTEDNGHAGRGGVVFLDALPVPRTLQIDLDVLTPHNSPYYAGAEKGEVENPPADYWQPSPVEFLTLSGGEFRLVLLAKDARLLKSAAKWVAEALQDQGIGAKTSAGYGYMSASVV